tara:strand:+ start:24 stop:131 length:108 start_codon:yes stop_codon:yes gene_type:complete
MNHKFRKKLDLPQGTLQNARQNWQKTDEKEDNEPS